MVEDVIESSPTARRLHIAAPDDDDAANPVSPLYSPLLSPVSPASAVPVARFRASWRLMPSVASRYAKSLSRGLRQLVTGGSRSARDAHRGMVGCLGDTKSLCCMLYPSKLSPS